MYNANARGYFLSGLLAAGVCVLIGKHLRAQ
jgi:hypothetical protein